MFLCVRSRNASPHVAAGCLVELECERLACTLKCGCRGPTARSFVPTTRSVPSAAILDVPVDRHGPRCPPGCPAAAMVPSRVCVCVLVLRKDTLYHYSALNSTMAFSRRPCTTQLPLGPGHPPISESMGGCFPPHICKQQRRGPPAWPKVAEGTSVWHAHVGRVGVARRRSSDSRES